jgi:hypothetical protein
MSEAHFDQIFSSHHKVQVPKKKSGCSVKEAPARNTQVTILLEKPALSFILTWLGGVKGAQSKCNTLRTMEVSGEPRFSDTANLGTSSKYCEIGGTKRAIFGEHVFVQQKARKRTFYTSAAWKIYRSNGVFRHAIVRREAKICCIPAPNTLSDIMCAPSCWWLRKWQRQGKLG